MPRNYFEKYAIEIRTNEHNHKKQRAHVHIYINGVEAASMFLDGTIKDGRLKSRDLKRLSVYIREHAEEFQAMWNEFQKSAY
ncbi:DUF4160 domain-containing protein [Streptococcus sp. zg-JUN1979]|uniref:DUF4160 domain-containing protein n=1 Tax=Streptococcus sp. zg-JUN1979 TaxID=3391450 RepID=UPI0039A7224B